MPSSSASNYSYDNDDCLNHFNDLSDSEFDAEARVKDEADKLNQDANMASSACGRSHDLDGHEDCLGEFVDLSDLHSDEKTEKKAGKLVMEHEVLGDVDAASKTA